MELLVHYAVADPEGGGGARGPCPPPPPRLVKIGHKKMETECGGLHFMFLGPSLSKDSGSATAMR